MELAFLSVAVDVGMAPSEAKATVANWMVWASRRPSYPYYGMLVGAPGRVHFQDTSFDVVAKLLVADAESETAERARAFIVVNIGEVIRRVDDLFQGAGR